jgi:hypothetical protein
MGKLVKKHLARLIVLTAAACLPISFTIEIFVNSLADHVAAAVQGFFWPKFFWDFLTKNFDGAVKPIPILQIINLILGLLVLALEWPLRSLAGTTVQQSIMTRLFALPYTALAATLIYQATDPALYYMIGMGVYFWAYCSGEASEFSLS